MKKESLSISMSKLIMAVSLIVGIWTGFEVSKYISIEPEIIVQPVMAQEKTLDKNSIPKWGYEKPPENTLINTQLNKEDTIFDYSINVSILIIIYGVIKFILAIRKKDKKKRYKAQKIIVYGFIFLIFLIFLSFPKGVVL